MKKLCMLLCCITLLAGCVSREQAISDKAGGKSQKQSASNEALQLKRWSFRSLNQGDGNEQGFYRIKTIDNGGGNLYSNILYTDYENKKEIFLCDKPECRHNDTSCTSYYAGLDMITQLIVQQDHVYLIANEDSVVNEKNETVTVPARILQMDLDGKNRKELCQLPSGYGFSYEDWAVAGDVLYVPVEKTENVSTEEGEMSSAVQVVREKKLYAIQLSSGEQKVVADMKNKSILGCMGRNLIVNAYRYKENPEELLDKGDFAGYDRASQQAEIAYERVNVDSGRVEKSFHTDADTLGVFVNDSMYYTDTGGMLKQLNMKVGKVYARKQLDTSSASLMFGEDDHLFLYLGEKEYIYSLKDDSLKPATLQMSDTQEPIRLLGESRDMYYVIYDQVGEVKKTWAGTDQYEASSYAYGLIKKKDYWNNKADYIPVDVIVKGE